MSRKLISAGSTALVTAVFAAGWFVSRAEDQAKPTPTTKQEAPETVRDDLPLRDYMRKKLAASNQIMEGLCTEDAAMILEGAQALNEMSSSERWRVSNDPMYRQFSGDFREVTQQLVAAAEKKNMDRAALKWMDATMSCIDCHRFVRGIRIADSDAK